MPVSCTFVTGILIVICHAYREAFVRRCLCNLHWIWSPEFAEYSLPIPFPHDAHVSIFQMIRFYQHRPRHCCAGQRTSHRETLTEYIMRNVVNIRWSIKHAHTCFCFDQGMCCLHSWCSVLSLCSQNICICVERKALKLPNRSPYDVISVIFMRKASVWALRSRARHKMAWGNNISWKAKRVKWRNGEGESAAFLTRHKLADWEQNKPMTTIVGSSRFYIIYNHWPKSNSQFVTEGHAKSSK